MIDSILFDQEWQRVAVDHAPMPSDQLAYLMGVVAKQEVRAMYKDAVAAGVDMFNIVAKLEDSGAINPLWRMYRPDAS